MPDDTTRATELTEASRGGCEASARQLLALLYGQLREMAEKRLQHGARKGSLDVSDLVHEVSLKLLARDEPFAGRSHFLAVGALALKHVLIDHFRARGQGGRSVSLSAVVSEHEAREVWDGLEFIELVEQLAVAHPRQARVMEMQFLGGMTNAEIAEALDVTDRTVRSDARYGRAWMRTRMGGPRETP